MIDWQKFPKFPERVPRIDAWFCQFENVMRHTHVDQEAWHIRLLECPSMDESLKSHLGELADFATMRKECLRQYGPPLPVFFWEQEAYRVKGSTREDVIDKLRDIRKLRNRAARMENAPEWNDLALIHPFVAAFPEPTQTKLRNEVRSVMRGEFPLQDLLDRAPSKDDMVVEPVVAAAGEKAEPTAQETPKSSSGEEQTPLFRRW